MVYGDMEVVGKVYFKIGGVSYLFDYKLLVWVYDDRGLEYYFLQFWDFEIGKDYGSKIEDIGGGGVFLKDSCYVFYVWFDVNYCLFKLFCYEIGIDLVNDVFVYEE